MVGAFIAKIKEKKTYAVKLLVSFYIIKIILFIERRKTFFPSKILCANMVICNNNKIKKC
jgi:hypothetical protein